MLFHPRRVRGRGRGSIEITCWPASLLAVALASGGPVLAAGGSPQSPPVAGQAEARLLKGGETVTLRVDLESGQFLRARVEQRGIDVQVAFYAPDGELVSKVDSPNGKEGPEVLSAVSGAAGGYRMVISSPKAEAPAGRIEVLLEKPRAATSEDRRLLAEEARQREALTEAVYLRRRGETGARRRALGAFEENLALWLRLGDPRSEAVVLGQIAALERRLGELPRALATYRRELAVWRDLDEPAQVGDTLLFLGAVHREMGDLGEAMARYREGLEVARSEGVRVLEARASSYLGDAHRLRGELDEAVRWLEVALAVFRDLGDRAGEAKTLNHLGAVDNSRGESRRAIELYLRALPILAELGDRPHQATTLNNLGVAYEHLGDVQRSLDHYRRALELQRAMGDRRAEATTLHNLGGVYQRLGELDEAFASYRRAEELREELGDRRGRGRTLSNLGWTHLTAGEPRAALGELERALFLSRASEDRRTEADALTGLGRARRELGDPAGALDPLELSRERSRALGDRRLEANALEQLARVSADLGRNDEALDRLRACLELRRDIGHRRGQAEALFEMARIERRLNRWNAARRSAEEALDLVESLRAGVHQQELKASFLASRHDYYGLLIDLLMEGHRRQPSAGFAAEAFRISERSRARGLLELLAETAAGIREGVDPRLLDEARALGGELNGFESHRLRLVDGGAGAGELAAAERAIAERLARYRELEGKIRISSPRYAALTQPRPLGLEEARQLLDDDTALLEIALGDERSYLWWITGASVETFELAGRRTLEGPARRFRELVTARNRRVEGEAVGERRRRLGLADEELEAVAAELGRLLLAPLGERLPARRLAVVSDGALRYVPFAALPFPPSPEGEPLIAGHEIVQLPSASVLAILRQEARSRRPAPPSLAVFADPVFHGADPRVARPAAAPPSKVPPYPRLRFSRFEARDILSLVPEDRRLAALDFAASRGNVVGGGLGSYRLIHFATHAVLDDARPELSGLALSMVDEGGEPRDGFVRLHDVYNLDLDADLVTLSACGTALGREVRGEGLIGLSRGFLYAGARRVAASLWSVQDKATAELMERFYRGLLEEGLPAAAALRRAQIAMWRQDRWRSPYYWSAFVLLGEWR